MLFPPSGVLTPDRQHVNGNTAESGHREEITRSPGHRVHSQILQLYHNIYIFFFIMCVFANKLKQNQVYLSHIQSYTAKHAVKASESNREKQKIIKSYETKMK